MIELNKTAIGIAAGVAGTLFIGYCIYFDNKRRSDPDYKQKVRERRRRNRKTATATRNGIPNLNDHTAMQRYFRNEIQLGENFISRGEFETGVEHLVNAIVVCGQPTRLLEVLQSSLSPQVFTMLIFKMQEFGNRANAEMNEASKIMGIPAAQGSTLAASFTGANVGAGDAILGGAVELGAENPLENAMIDDLE